jgi:hypothetical protein
MCKGGRKSISRPGDARPPSCPPCPPSRITTESSAAMKINPLPHMYVVKDLVPVSEQTRTCGFGVGGGEGSSRAPICRGRCHRTWRISTSSTRPSSPGSRPARAPRTAKSTCRPWRTARSWFGRCPAARRCRCSRPHFFDCLTRDAWRRCAGRHVRVHSLRLLQHFVPILLVERGPVPWPRRSHAGAALDGGFAGEGPTRL